MFHKPDTRIHFVGIGGIGMSGIAEVLLTLGYGVSGTDLKESDTTRRLVELGATIKYGHDAAHLDDADVVVISSAVKPTNPEVAAARARGIPVIPRAEMLAELMRMKYGVAVAGSHGKTTTTSLVATVLHQAGLDPTVVIGGKLPSLVGLERAARRRRLPRRRGRRVGRLVHEAVADGRRGHQHRSRAPRSLRHARRAQAHVRRLHQQGALLRAGGAVRRSRARAVDPAARREAARDLRLHAAGALPRDRRRLRRAAHDASPRSCAASRSAASSWRCPGGTTCSTRSRCSPSPTSSASTSPSTSARSPAFSGVGRRFTVRGEARGVMVVDDYGHHPAEIRATLAGARTGFKDRRIVAAFQPHRYTRTRDLHGRVRARVQRGRPRRRLRHLRRRRGADRGRDRARGSSTRCARSGHLRRTTCRSAPTSPRRSRPSCATATSSSRSAPATSGWSARRS